MYRLRLYNTGALCMYKWVQYEVSVTIYFGGMYPIKEIIKMDRSE